MTTSPRPHSARQRTARQRTARPRLACTLLAGLLGTALTVPLAAPALARTVPDAFAADAAGVASKPSPSASDASVTIKRDSYGIPHVYADTTFDLFRGYGYVVAEDRLFQMEMSRRSTQGTVAEVLGADYLALDKDTLSGFDPASIKAQIAALPADDRAILEGYAAGMNERIAEVRQSPGTLLPKQFADFGFEPSDWTAYDVAMVWIGTMANRYSDYSEEISNYQVLQQLIAANGPVKGRALFEQLVWTEDPLAPTTVPGPNSGRLPEVTGSNGAGAPGASTRPKALPSLKPVSPQLQDTAEAQAVRHGSEGWPGGAPKASNLWAVGASKASGAKSILVNGPQFQWFNPSYVFGIGLHGAGFDFAGNTPFAYPAVIFGTNNEISWGATAGPMNVVDVYQETLAPDNDRKYRYDGAWRDMTVRHETIKVKGGEDVPLDVLSTVHGFVTSVDPANRTAYSKKRSYAGLEVQSLITWARMPQAKNFEEFRARASKFAISINWYYSDARGNIGYISPGRLPNRPGNQDMRIPALGDGSMEWQGYADFSQNPQVLNPAQGFIMNWNNEAAPGFNNDYSNWGPVDRANEIDSALRERSRFSPQQMWDLNERFSFADLNLRYLQPVIAKAAANLPSGDPRRADLALIASWDGETRDRDGDGVYDGPQPAIMRTWLPILFEKVLADDLPPAIYQAYTRNIYQTRPVETRGSVRPANALKLVFNNLLGDKAGVPQTVDFFNGETPQDVIVDTYLLAVASLRTEKGTNTAAWTVPISPMQFSSKNFLGVPQAAAGETIIGAQHMNRGSENNMAVLGGKPRLCLVAPPGQSGFVAPDGTKSPHYADQLEMFNSFQCREEHLTASAVDAAAVTTTRLP